MSARPALRWVGLGEGLLLTDTGSIATRMVSAWAARGWPSETIPMTTVTSSPVRTNCTDRTEIRLRILSPTVAGATVSSGEEIPIRGSVGQAARGSGRRSAVWLANPSEALAASRSPTGPRS